MNRESTTPLQSFACGMNVVVIGASGGIGSALTSRLVQHPDVSHVVACSRSARAQDHAKLHRHRLDLEDEETVADAARSIKSEFETVDLVIVATGILHEGDDLHPEKTWRALNAERLARVYRINTIGPALIAKHFLPLLARDRKSVFAALSARVGSIADNELGGWHAYRASKAALNMLIRNFAIELQRRNAGAICVGLHPGTVDTGLSQPFQANVPEGKLFSPDFVADRLLRVVDGLEPQDSGRQFAWNGEVVPC